MSHGAQHRSWRGQELRDPDRPEPVERPCLCCRRPFGSEGPHNRLCGTCRGRTADLSPFAV